MEANLLDTILSGYLDRKTQVTFVLQNRTRVIGRVRAFDSYIVFVEGERNVVLYRHAVSSVSAAPVAAQHRQAERKPEPVRPAAKAAPQRVPPAPRTQKEKAAPRTAAAEPSLNTSMKEGLLRWMQERKNK